MKVTGLITEYNPFHNGHLYHIKESKKRTNADYTIVVMSGNFVQRGAPALVDKYHRTRMALLGGADLVLELPVVYAAASAESFAYGAVKCLHSTGVVDAVSFGSEEGDVNILTEIAKLLSESPESFSLLLKKHLKSGRTFPQARALALAEYAPWMDDNHRKAALASPNNILGIEYIKALIKLNSPIQPVTIQRLMTGYHDLSLDSPVSSATAIRSFLASGKNLADITAVLPPHVYPILEAAPWLENRDFSSLLSYRLATLPAAKLTAFLDVSPDLARRIKAMETEYLPLDDFITKLKTRQYTHTRISRALLHILLDIRDEDLYASESEPFLPYLRVLGFQKSAAPLLKAIKNNGSAPLLTKVAGESHPLFLKDIQAAHIYNSVLSHKYGISQINEYKRSPVIL